MSATSTQTPIAVNQEDTTFYRFDSLTGFWGVPNMERQFSYMQLGGKTITVRHNEDGNRDRSYAPQSKKPTVFCIGGSHTWGGGVEAASRYSDLLAQDTGWQVVNAGHCSLGLDQICLAILERSPRYNPSVIIVEQYPWAIHRILNSYVNGYVKPYFDQNGRGELALHKVPKIVKNPLLRKWVGAYYAYRKELREYRGGINLKKDYDAYADPIFLSWKFNYYTAMYDLAQKIIGVIASACHQRNVRVIFALGAVLQDLNGKSSSALIDYALPKKRFIEALEKCRLPYVDMAETMRAEHTPDSPVVFPDGHINEKGHKIFAQELAREIQRLGWLKKQ